MSVRTMRLYRRTGQRLINLGKTCRDLSEHDKRLANGEPWRKTLADRMKVEDGLAKNLCMSLALG